jgi:hypothetical protein
MKRMFNEGNQIHNFISSSGSGTVINYGSGSEILTSYGSGSTSQKVTVPTVPVPVPVPQHCKNGSKLVCNINIVNGNLKFENSQDNAPETSTKLHGHEFGFRWGRIRPGVIQLGLNSSLTLNTVL